jgi:hypothetical protein
MRFSTIPLHTALTYFHMSNTTLKHLHNPSLTIVPLSEDITTATKR